MSFKKKKLFTGIFIGLLFVTIVLVYYYGEKRQKQAAEVNVAEYKKEAVQAKNEEVKKQEPKKEEPKKEEPKKDVKMKNNDQGVPVLMYHSIGYEKDNSVRIPKEKFEEEMKYLKDNDYTTLTLDELYDFLINNRSVPEKSVVLTFDDGYKDNFTDMYPIIKKYGFKATIFIITDLVDKNAAYLTLEELLELDKNGIDIESHTTNHDDLSTLSYKNQLKTLRNSKEFIEKTLNKKVNYIAYPFGKYNKNTIKAAKEAGYTMALSTSGRWSDKEDGIYSLDRVFISGFHDLKTFEERITNPNYKK